MKKVKRITAMVGVVLLLTLYLITLVAAVTASKHANALFLASAFSTIAVPIMIYAFMFVYRIVHKKDDEISFQDLKKKNKEYEKNHQTKDK